MDCFAVSLSFGTTRKLVWRDILLMAALFGLFQGAMPLIGWFVGSSIQSFIAPVDHWIAFVILASIGLKMIWQSFGMEDEKRSVDIRKITVLLTLSIATSIDALVIGVSLAFLNVNILYAATSFTIITFIVSLIGLYIGKHTRKLIFGKDAEIIGGLVLIGLAIKILNEHIGFISSLWQ